MGTLALLAAVFLAGCSSSDDETAKHDSSSSDASEGPSESGRDTAAARLDEQLSLPRKQRQQDSDRELERHAMRLRRIADNNTRTGYFDTARENHEEVLQINRRLYGDNSWQVTRAMVELNAVRWILALSDEARRTLREATKLRPEGKNFFDQGDYAKATDKSLEELKVWQDVGGDQQVQYAMLLRFLANCLQRQLEFRGAESYHQQSVELIRSQVGEHHPEYGSALSFLGVMYQHQGDFEKAKPFFVEANEIRAETLGTDHYTYALGLMHLADLQRDMGDLRAAATLLKQVLKILAKHEEVGDQHIDYSLVQKKLALVHLEAGDLDEAESLVKKAMTIGKSAPQGVKDNNYAFATYVMGRLEQQRRDYKKAEVLLRDSLRVISLWNARKNPAYAKTQLFLGQVYLAQGRYRDAESALKDSLANTQFVLGPSHPRLALHLNCYAELLRKTGRAGEAGTLESRAREIQARMANRTRRTTQQ